jgi:hypothetical protein
MVVVEFYEGGRGESPLNRVWNYHVTRSKPKVYNKFLEITNLTLFFVYLFIYFISLHVSSVTVLIIRRSNCINTSSGMISLCDCLVCLTGIQSSHLHRLIIPDDVLIQFDLLMMSPVTLETCREMK